VLLTAPEDAVVAEVDVPLVEVLELDPQPTAAKAATTSITERRRIRPPYVRAWGVFSEA
jgi:hypothetical protein